jgi:hypothetical protein
VEIDPAHSPNKEEPYFTEMFSLRREKKNMMNEGEKWQKGGKRRVGCGEMR